MSDKRIERRGLGRGLSALMADVDLAAKDRGTPDKKAESLIPIEQIVPNPDQPRRRFSPDALRELSDSIREKGVIQPLILRAHPQLEGKYEIVAGERRWRAAQMAQVHELPAIIRTFSDTEVLEVAIIENIQRSDLDPLEEALGYRQLMERFGHTQEKLAEALSKSRSHIANQLRLLSLPEQIQTLIQEGKLTAGHARALITADDPLRLAQEVVSKGLSVREVERLAKAEGKPGSAPRSGKAKAAGAPEKDADTKALEADLSAATGMKVRIEHGPGNGGAMVLHYENLEDLDRLCQALSLL